MPTRPAAHVPLRLLAEDVDDLEIMSAALQDAVGKVGDILFEPSRRQLTLAVNRYVWEAGERSLKRVRCALQLGGVMSVKSRNLRRDAPDAIVSVLAVQFEPAEAPGGLVRITLSGDGDLAVEVECIDAAMSDVGEPWAARGAPRHDAPDQDRE